MEIIDFYASDNKDHWHKNIYEKSVSIGEFA